MPVDINSISLSTDAATGSNVHLYLYGYHVPSSATSCSGGILDKLLWHIRDLGNGVTPLSFDFPTPLQYKPLANRNACLLAQTSTSAITTINVVGFCGG